MKKFKKKLNSKLYFSLIFTFSFNIFKIIINTSPNSFRQIFARSSPIPQKSTIGWGLIQGLSNSKSGATTNWPLVPIVLKFKIFDIFNKFI